MLSHSGRTVFLTLLVSCAVQAATVPPASPVRKPKPNDPSDQLFSSLMPRLFIRVSPDDLNSLRMDPRMYVHATVIEGDRSYTNVAIHLKGSRGSLRPVDSKPGLTLNFDHFQKGQLFHGLDKVHLNNLVQDSSYMNEVVGSALCLAAGLPTARGTHAHVSLNDRDLGVFVLIEGYNTRFLKRYFANPDGNLYDNGSENDITVPLEKTSGKGPDDHSDLRKLANAAGEPEPARRVEAVAQVLDLDRFITFVAMERIMTHWDGYSGNRNNYRLYNDPSTGHFVFIPHGMDQLFRDPNFPLMPGLPSTVRDGGPGPGRIGGRGGRGGILISIFNDPAMRTHYLQRVGELLDQVFTPERINPILVQIEERVRTQLGTTEPELGATMVQKIADIRARLTARVQGAREEYKWLAAQDLKLPSRTITPIGTNKPPGSN